VELHDISLEEALDRLLCRPAPPKRAETLPLAECLGRICGETLGANFDQPPFDRSPLDGFAVRHGDIAAAARDRPVFLRVSQAIYAGTPGLPLGPGEAARIMTGAPIPPGATAVVRLEDSDNGKDRVGIFVSLREYENYCFSGEDLRKGREIISAGSPLNAAALSVLASQGFREIPVTRRPRAGILSTGSELLPAGAPLEPGKIYDSNRVFLEARIRELGGEPVSGLNAADDPEQIAGVLEELLSGCDMVFTTGGVSVGDHDYLPSAGKRIGAELLFRRVQMKPGGWVTAMEKDGKLLLCLSGNPFAAICGFELLGAPLLCRAAGLASFLPRRVQALLADPWPRPSPARRFLSGRLEGGRLFLSKTGYASGSLASLIGCNCLVDIPPQSPPLPVGAPVEAALFMSRPSGALPDREREGGNPAAVSAKAPPGPGLAVCGIKNSGKTTFLAGVIPLLRERGLRIAVIKHDAHDFSPDVPGTDSCRLAEAGAAAVAVYSPRRYMLREEKGGLSPDELLGRFSAYDLTLIEGAKDSGYPKIEILRKAVSAAPVCDASTLLALCTDTELELPGIPSLALDDYEGAAALIFDYVKERGRAQR
jgi:molybdopterin molybdotransferase